MPVDMTDQFNTPLTPEEEAQFRAAYPDPRDLVDYGLRGAWKAGAHKAGNGHLPDTFKKPNHPTFSKESQYSTPQTPGGEWQPMGNNKWKFVAAPGNLQYQSPAELQDYFNRVEQGNTLVLPDQLNPGAAFEGAIQ